MRSTQSAGRRDIAALLHGYCRLLAQHGISAFRATMPISTLHPQIKALRYVWYDEVCDPGPFPSPALFHREIHTLDDCTIDEAFLTYDARVTPQYLQSPFHRLQQSAG